MTPRIATNTLCMYAAVISWPAACTTSATFAHFAAFPSDSASAADKPGALVGVNVDGALNTSQQVTAGGYQSYSITFFAGGGTTVRLSKVRSSSIETARARAG